MAHFAELDENDLVIRVVRINNDAMVADDGQELEQLGILECERVIGPGRWIQTSYNTHQGVHFDSDLDAPDGGIAFRGNYAQPGFKYYADLDIFAQAVRPEGTPEWFVLNERGLWVCPVGIDPNTGLELSDEQWDFLVRAYGQPSPLMNPDVGG
jgi:hypothetical protein